MVVLEKVIRDSKVGTKGTTYKIKVASYLLTK
jgi:hypothetical protein